MCQDARHDCMVNPLEGAVQCILGSGLRENGSFNSRSNPEEPTILFRVEGKMV